ncbi:RNA-binding domain-containing protein, partial [Jaminaea rosea]
MASHLASIYGTEQDKVNCSFYYKIGACRHGDRCSRKHTKPAFSQTIMVANVYSNPRYSKPDANLSDDEIQDDFDDFYEDFFCQLAEYGQLVEMHVCDNVGDHLIGNVYARYEWEDEAQRAVDALNNKWYNARPLFAELSPVTDFREACCRQNETKECNRGGHCNFMHIIRASGSLVRQLNHELAVELRMKKEKGGGKKGWKEELAEENGGSDDGPSWKKGKSSGNWRSGPRGEDGDATNEEPRD